MKTPLSDEMKVGGVLTAAIKAQFPERAVIQGADVSDHDGLIIVKRHNAFLTQGLQRVIDRLFEPLTGANTGLSHIGLGGDNTAVTASTTTLGTPNNIKPLTNTSRALTYGQGEATWTNVDVAFPIYKAGLLWGTAPTDVANIIGGSGGSAPYDRSFTMDLTNAGEWTMTVRIRVTALAL